MFKVPGVEGKEFDLEVGRVEKVAGLEVPVFEAKTDKTSILKGMDVSLVKQELEAIATDQIKGEFVSDAENAFNLPSKADVLLSKSIE